MPKVTSYTEEMADEICEHVGNGNSLRSFCEKDGRPTFSTVYKWLDQQPAFADAFARARERQAHADADRINYTLEACERLQLPPDVTRVVVDALKWTASRRLPKAYGDKVALAGNDGAPIVVRWADGSD